MADVKMTEEQYEEMLSTLEGRAELAGRTVKQQAKYELAMLKARRTLMRGGRN